MRITATARSHATLHDVVILEFPTPDSNEANREVLEVIRGAVYSVSSRKYYVPRALWLAVREQILSSVHELAEDVDAFRWAREDKRQDDALVSAAADRADVFDVQLKKRGLALRDYQKAGINWLCQTRAGLLTDEPGLGKTVQTVCSIPEAVGVVIVCPASLRGWWRDETALWRPDYRVELVEGHGALKRVDTGVVYICSDASLYDVEPLLEGPTFLAADEAHGYKNENAIRTQQLKAFGIRIRRGGGWTIGLTGTPLLNHPQELYTLAEVFGCHQLGWGSYAAFRRAFEMVDGPFGVTFGKPRAAAREGLARISLRRTRTEVLPELPPKSYQYLPVTLPRKLCRTLDELTVRHSKSLDDWEWHDVMPTFDKFAEVRADLAKLKTAAALEWVEQHEAAGVPVVVFSAHRSAIDLLKERAGWCVITGDVDPVERTRLVWEFEAGRYMGIAGTIGAMGTGHTLTRASNVLFVDRSFTPGLNSQAEDRVYRLGQKMAVLITILAGDHPLENRLEKILTKKSGLVQAAMA